MTSRRPYIVRPKRTKVTAVLASEITTIKAAAKKYGVPERTLRHWRENPELAELAAKTREDMAEGALALAQATMSEISRRLPEFEPRDLSVLYGILIDKGQLLAGGATSRSEHRDLADEMNDHERALMRDAIDNELERRKVDVSD